MTRTALALLVLLSSCTKTEKTTQYDTSSIFAHNDYARPVPFYTAYNLGVGYIEADVFLQDSALLVAHHAREIKPGRNLGDLYLRPLSTEIKNHDGSVYPDSKSRLTLMIDLKTEGVPTLAALVRVLEKYPDLVSCPTLTIMISGNVPDPATWGEYPRHITFDGRPGIAYTQDQLQRISMISTNFRDHAKWDGTGEVSEEDRAAIQKLIETAHDQGKKFRFWATPDFAEAWQGLMNLDMDVIVTDDVTGLAEFLKRQK